jgi:hypothetical protein
MNNERFVTTLFLTPYFIVVSVIGWLMLTFITAVLAFIIFSIDSILGLEPGIMIDLLSIPSNITVTFLEWLLNANK